MNKCVDSSLVNWVKISYKLNVVHGGWFDLFNRDYQVENTRDKNAGSS